MTLNNLNWTLEFYEENVSECNKILNSSDIYEKVPLINCNSFQNFTDGSLVRYQGMVQDMLNPEYYSGLCTVVNSDNGEKFTKSGKYRDVMYCKANQELNEIDFNLLERLVFFCVSIPGTNSWVRNCEKQKKDVVYSSNKLSSRAKREANDEDEEMDCDDCDSAKLGQKKKNKIDMEITEPQTHTYNITKYFPLPGESELPCIVKIYAEDDKTDLILNDRIEVIGFLSLNPALEDVNDGEDTNFESKALHPPPSLVPRIHSVLLRKLYHFNPLLKQIICYDDIANILVQARSDLHLALTQLLFEDAVAAEYLLCHLLSRVYDFGSYLNEVVKSITTNSHYMPLSIQTLNETIFVPKKDYASNRLCSGILQLCDDVHLILDETKMSEGRLNDTGCKNVAALQRLCRDQEVVYDFGYYPVKYNSNIPLLILSEGKSMFETDIRIKVKSNIGSDSSLKESYEAVRLYLNENILNTIRIYLTSMRMRDFELGEDMARRIGEDYVNMRQQNKQINSSDLHILLLLSRLLALSHGRTVLNVEDWTRAVEMEAERKLRMSSS